MARQKTKVAKQEEPLHPVLTKLLNLDNQDATYLLSSGNHKGTGALDGLTRHELEQLVPQTIGLGIARDRLTILARYVVEAAMKKRNGASSEALAQHNAAYVSTLNFHLKLNREQQEKTMSTETAVAKPRAAKKSKKAAKTAKAKSAKAAKKSGESRASRYAGRKIKVLNKTHGLRPNTWTHFMVETAVHSKNTDDAQATVDASSDYKGKRVDFKWLSDKGFIAVED